MVNRILLALAVAIFLGAGGYTLLALDGRSFRLAEASADSCEARYGTGAAPEEKSTRCTRPMRDYSAGRIWRYVFAASVGATFALLVVGGIVILLRRQRGEEEVPPGRSGS
jgi:hypothetical protein